VKSKSNKIVPLKKYLSLKIFPDDQTRKNRAFSKISENHRSNIVLKSCQISYLICSSPSFLGTDRLVTGYGYYTVKSIYVIDTIDLTTVIELDLYIELERIDFLLFFLETCLFSY
jgi:hypothetical protein